MTTYGYHADPLIDAAIAEAQRTHPYYAPAIARLRITADPAVATMATSAQWVTHYNPATVAEWTVAERGAVLVHEVEHLLRQHHERCGDRDPGRFNVAGDAEINQRLSGLPDGVVYPATLGMPNGLAAEAYYGAQGGRQPDPEPGDDGSGSGDDGSGSGDDGSGSGDDGSGDDGSGNGSGTAQDGAGSPGTAKCGSAAGGPTQDHERGDAAAPGEGARDGGKQARREVAREVLGAGDSPGQELRDWAEDTLGIDRAAWYRALAGVVGTVAAPYGAPTRYRWPGRRDMRDMGGAMVPRWVGERPSIAVVIDTSSSISALDLDMARAAGHFISRVADCTFYGCDTDAVRYGSAMPESIVGGGGTYLPAGIAMAIADGARAVVVITDCETRWGEFAEAGRVPIIIGANVTGSAIARGERAWPAPPEWFTVVPITQESTR